MVSPAQATHNVKSRIKERTEVREVDLEMEKESRDEGNVEEKMCYVHLPAPHKGYSHVL